MPYMTLQISVYIFHIFATLAQFNFQELAMLSLWLSQSTMYFIFTD